ncbi:MAG TPA: nucleoside deaminase [Candidatus Nitrosopolaris sp.]|nr:nucleoside deaminase [Candidatus Nitrosopolaris sp.]
MHDFLAARASLDPGAWRALERALDALRSGGLPCGSCLVDSDGNVIAEGRNHAYDPVSGSDLLEQTPLAHAELNVLARVSSDRDLGRDTLWSTQQPCSMCTAAIQFCGVGNTRYLAADPAFLGTDDVRAGKIVDPTLGDPTLGPWAVLATLMFLHPAIEHAGANSPRVQRNRLLEPEATDLALAVHNEQQFSATTDGLDDVAAGLWSRLHAVSEARSRRLAKR